jgi:hypothetical protein
LIAHPENISYGAEGREIAIFDQDEFHLVDMRLVEVVELSPETSPSGLTSKE